MEALPVTLMQSSVLQGPRPPHRQLVIQLPTLQTNEGNKKPLKKNRGAFFLPKVGIEPTYPKVHDFESCASACSATPARCSSIPAIPSAGQAHLHLSRTSRKFQFEQKHPPEKPGRRLTIELILAYTPRSCQIRARLVPLHRCLI